MNTSSSIEYLEYKSHIDLYFQQNRAALDQFKLYMEKLAEAIDTNNVEFIAHYLTLLRGVYHLLEGNNVNIQTLVIDSHPALSYLQGESPVDY